MSTVQLEQTVYVIDDDEAVRQSLEFLLKTVGIKVFGFESAKVFLEKLPEDVFLKFMERKGKLGSQHKFPRVMKGKMLQDWNDFLKARLELKST